MGKASRLLLFRRRKKAMEEPDCDKPKALRNPVVNTPKSSVIQVSPEDSGDSSENEEVTKPEDPSMPTVYKWALRILYLLLWLTVYAIFIKLMFGTVYLLVSGLVAMYLNTRSGPKKENEISAYSVFNDNCKSIDGTLKAEQFEKEIRSPFSGIR